MRAQKLPNLFWNTINSMYVCMHTAVPAAHCAMVYYVVHIINFYNHMNRKHGFRPGIPTYISLGSHGQYHRITVVLQ